MLGKKERKAKKQKAYNRSSLKWPNNFCSASSSPLANPVYNVSATTTTTTNITANNNHNTTRSLVTKCWAVQRLSPGQSPYTWKDRRIDGHVWSTHPPPPTTLRGRVCVCVWGGGDNKKNSLRTHPLGTWIAPRQPRQRSPRSYPRRHTQASPLYTSRFHTENSTHTSRIFRNLQHTHTYT